MESVLRILDAAANRAAEGLRVVEDYVRFVLGDSHLTTLVKQLRHDLAAAARAIPASVRHADRDTLHDVGTTIATPSESQRPDAWAVCQASLERTKQSLRSLEEFGKVLAPELGAAFELLRYRLYTLEAALGRTVDAVERLAGVRLCVLIDGRESEEGFAALVGDLVSAGVGMIQLRDKQAPLRQLVDRARMLVHRTRRGRIASACPDQADSPDQAWSGLPPLAIVNDRPDVAAAVDADGVHVGQDDFAVKDARAVLGPRKLIGVSTHSIEQARQAVLDGANYVGIGPMFPSATKPFDAFPGPELARAVAAEIRLPAFAIGGIDSKNVEAVLAAGIQRVAVSSAIVDAASPGEAISELLAAFAAAAVANAAAATV
jgi:thiamine-phosphate pyrophosphorylase